MSLVVKKVRLRPGHVRGEPDPVRVGDHAGPRGLARWRPDTATAPRSNPQSPRKAMSSSCHPSVLPDPAADSARAMKSANRPVRAALSTSETRPPRARGDVVGTDGRRELRRLPGQEFGERCTALGGQAELVDVLGAHAVEPVEALGVVGGDAGDDGGRVARLGHERGAGERMRTTTRPADGDEAVVPEEVEDLARHRRRHRRHGDRAGSSTRRTRAATR